MKRKPRTPKPAKLETVWLRNQPPVKGLEPLQTIRSETGQVLFNIYRRKSTH